MMYTTGQSKKNLADELNQPTIFPTARSNKKSEWKTQ